MYRPVVHARCPWTFHCPPLPPFQAFPAREVIRWCYLQNSLTGLGRLVLEGWLDMQDDPNGRGGRHTAKRLTLGVRSIIDLQHFISDTWRDDLCCEWFCLLVPC